MDTTQRTARAVAPAGAEQGEVELDAGPPPPAQLRLAADFPAAGRDDWQALVDQVLRKAGRIDADAPRGAGVEALTRTTLDGVRVSPLYTAPDAPDPRAAGVPGAAPFVRGARPVTPEATGPGAGAAWDIRQRHADPDPDAARAAVRADLDNGVTSIWLAVGAGGTAPADLTSVLAALDLDRTTVVLDASADTAATEQAAAAALLDHCVTGGPAGGTSPAALRATLGLDPIGRRARTGTGPGPDDVVAVARRAAAECPQVRTVVVDALLVHGAGASDAQELGFSLAAGVAYLRALTDGGLDLEAAAAQLEFRYAATAEQFPTIAKLRAARLLWARVTAACGAGSGSGSGQRQHAVSSPAMRTRRDPYGNLLRGTVAAFAAGVGGADAVTVAPFDAALGAPDQLSRRIARNTASLLVQESQLGRVHDPAGGSWYVESFTRELAAAAWAFFQEIESAGGVLAALDDGLVADRVAAVRARRETAAATRAAPIVGVSVYADPAEPARPEPPTPPDVPRAGGGLPVYRPAEPYERLRDRSDALLAATGTRPRVFLATLGPLASWSARAGFVRNLLQAGGVEAPDAGPTETVEDVVARFREAGSPLAVLCASDAGYAERAAPTVAALRTAGATHVLLAGGAVVPGLDPQQLDGRVVAGGDAPALLDSVHTAWEARR